MRFRKSLSHRFWLWLAGLSLLIVVILGGTVDLYLRDFYMAIQTRQLTDQAQRIVSSLETLPQEQYDDALQLMQVTQDGTLMVFTSTGDLMAMTRRPMMGTGMGLGMGMGMGSGRGGGPAPYGQGGGMLLSQDLLSRAIHGETVTTSGVHPRLGVSIVEVGVPMTGAFQGALFLNTPLAPIDDMLGNFQMLVLKAGLVALALSLLISWYFSRRLVKPIVQMQQAASRLAQQDFAVRLDVESHDELGHLAADFNHMAESLAQAREALQVDRDRLRQLVEQRREFLANVAHELKTPLSIVQGYSEAIVDGVYDAEGRAESYAAIISDEAQRMRRLVDELMDFVQLEQAPQLVLDDLVPCELIDEVKTKMAPLAVAKGLRLVTQCPAKVTIAADHDRILQALVNLTGNAIRHSPPDGIVTIDAQEYGDELRFAVEDEGPGVPPEQREAVWERFYKGDKARVRDNSGLGLGLSIVKAIAQAHGGRVGLEAAEPHGSRFYFTVPIKTAQC